MKKCKDCEIEKNFTEFYLDKVREVYSSYCRACHKVRTQAWRASEAGLAYSQSEETKKSVNERSKRWRELNPGNPWAKANPEKYKESKLKSDKKYYNSNREALLASKRDYYHNRNGKIKTRAWFLKNKYNLTLEQYDLMLAAQDGKCRICACISTTNLHVDHDHATGKVRGLLCSSCNTMIGLAKENPKILEGAIEYLSKTNL